MNKRTKQTFFFFPKQEVQMANSHMKRWSTSLTIMEMQIKTKIRRYFIHVKMAIIKKNTNNKCWKGYEEMGTLIHY